MTGLLRHLKSIEEPRNISQYHGMTVAVDGYAWLHRGAVACAWELGQGIASTKHIDYVIRRVQMLLNYGVTPYLVFDGDDLPSKAETNRRRKQSRQEAREKALKMLRSGNKRDAYQQFQKCVDITPEMAALVIHKVRALGVPCVVAPYEADAQMVYLEKHGYVQAIVSEDSDLLVFGAQRLLTKMAETGDLIEIRREKLPQCTELNLRNFSDSQFRLMAILSGCDYSDGVPKVGLKTANKLIQQYKTTQAVMAAIGVKYAVPEGFDAVLRRADLTFQHQRVYCVKERKLIMLNEPSEPITEPNFEWFIGEDVEHLVCRRICDGKVDPRSKLEFTLDPTLINKCINLVRPPTVKAPAQSFLTPTKPTVARPFASCRAPPTPTATVQVTPVQRSQRQPLQSRSTNSVPTSTAQKRFQSFFDSDSDSDETATPSVKKFFNNKPKPVTKSINLSEKTALNTVSKQSNTLGKENIAPGKGNTSPGKENIAPGPENEVVLISSDSDSSPPRGNWANSRPLLVPERTPIRATTSLSLSWDKFRYNPA